MNARQIVKFELWLSSLEDNDNVRVPKLTGEVYVTEACHLKNCFYSENAEGLLGHLAREEGREIHWARLYMEAIHGD